MPRRRAKSYFPLTAPAVRGWGVAALLLAGIYTVTAGEFESDPQPVPRRILALYDGAIELTAAETRIHRFAEMPLNHLGFVVSYHDIRSPLPEIRGAKDVAGILTWFSVMPANRVPYLGWAAAAVRSGKRIVILGAIGGDASSGELGSMNVMLDAMGLRLTRRAVDVTFGTEFVRGGHGRTAFERGPDPVLPAYPIVQAIRPGVDVWVELAVPAREEAGRSTVVAVGPGGGYAAAGFEMAEEKSLNRVRWLIDPFAFFAGAFGKLRLVPDVTTRSGRRIFFSHVDGEGLVDVVTLNSGVQTPAPRVFLDEIIRPYPALPVSFGVAAGDLDPSIGGNGGLRDLVKEIWALPQVEPSAFSYTRPYRWKFFEKYDRASERRLIKQTFEAERHQIKAIIGRDVDDDLEAHIDVQKRLLPRAYLWHPFNLDTEIRGALNVVRALAPADKHVRLYQWTGDARPFEKAIARTRELGLLNINGGESRFDTSYPSLAYVAPIARPVGAQRQIYSVGSGDATASTDWRPVASALRGLQVVAAKTELPRRLKGFNLHYPLSAVGAPKSLRLLKRYLEQAQKASLMPMRAGEYAAMADDFFEVEVRKLGKLQWAVARRGTVQTIRIDDPTAEVDLDSSVGVLGANRHARSLYLALDSAVDTALIALSDQPQLTAAAAGLSESRWNVWQLRRRDCGFAYATNGFGPGEFVWYGVALGKHSIVANRHGEPVWAQTLEPDSEGRLSFVIPQSGLQPLSVDVACLAAAEGP